MSAKIKSSSSLSSSSRRSFLKMAGTAAYSLAMFEAFAKKARAQTAAPLPVANKLLFVISGGGGASIVDSFMCVKQSEVTSDPNAMIAYPDNFVSVDAATGLRALSLPQDHRNYLGGFGVGTPYDQATFLSRFKDDSAVLTLEGTSVNHLVAQKRSMNGFGINNDRTLLEEVAARHGQSLLLPNINMTSGGYLEQGTDPTLDERARQEIVADALLLLALHRRLARPRGRARHQPRGHVAAGAGRARRRRHPRPCARDLLARARGVRDQLDDASVFGQTFQCSPLREKLRARRNGVNLDMETRSLITNLTLIAENDLPQISHTAAVHVRLVAGARHRRRATRVRPRRSSTTSAAATSSTRAPRSSSTRCWRRRASRSCWPSSACRARWRSGRSSPPTSTRSR